MTIATRIKITTKLQIKKKTKLRQIIMFTHVVLQMRVPTVNSSVRATEMLASVWIVTDDKKPS